MKKAEQIRAAAVTQLLEENDLLDDLKAYASNISGLQIALDREEARNAPYGISRTLRDGKDALFREMLALMRGALVVCEQHPRIHRRNLSMMWCTAMILSPEARYLMSARDFFFLATVDTEARLIKEEGDE